MTPPRERRRASAVLALWSFAALLAFAGLLALGTWQVHRLAWKEALIARVDARIHAAAVAAPGPAHWADVSTADDEYRRVVVTGRFENDRETLVQAVTALGAGYWVLTPLRTSDGWTVLVDRGFVPADRRDPLTRSAGQAGGVVTVAGLLRISEPYGAFLRRNDPRGDRWFSRDVAAIAAARGLGAVAPYFIDADASADRHSLPVGGLTVVRFPNNHLVYALTWYALAAMVAFFAARLGRDEWRLRHPGRSPGRHAAARML